MKSVLLVDDDEEYLRVAASTLRDEGFIVQVAPDGDDALAVLAHARELPGLVLLDAMMPRMSGEAFLSAARPTYPGLVVVVISAYAKSLPLADGALPKPVKLDDLLSIVREFCGDGQFDREEAVSTFRLRLPPRE